MTASEKVPSLTTSSIQNINSFQSYDAKTMYPNGEKDEPEDGELESSLPLVDKTCSKNNKNEASQKFQKFI